MPDVGCQLGAVDHFEHHESFRMWLNPSRKNLKYPQQSNHTISCMSMNSRVAPLTGLDRTNGWLLGLYEVSRGGQRKGIHGSLGRKTAPTVARSGSFMHVSVLE